MAKKKKGAPAAADAPKPPAAPPAPPPAPPADPAAPPPADAAPTPPPADSPAADAAPTPPVDPPAPAPRSVDRPRKRKIGEGPGLALVFSGVDEDLVTQVGGRFFTLAAQTATEVPEEVAVALVGPDDSGTGSVGPRGVRRIYPDSDPRASRNSAAIADAELQAERFKARQGR